MLKLTMNPRKRSKRTRSAASNKSQSRYNSKGNSSSSSSNVNNSSNMAVDDDDTYNQVNEQKEMLADNITALFRQERSKVYDCVDYLSMTEWEQNVYDLLGKQLHHNAQGESRLDEYCREQIVEWTFRVVDYFRIDREVVAMSLNLLDRFLATCQCDRTTFKLAATTTLNLAVKLLHPYKLGELGILSDLSRGEFDMRDVAKMESHVLRTLNWNLHPPTVVAFASLILDYVFTDQSINMSPVDVDDLYDIASFFAELAVCDYFFVTVSPSQASLACILNALEGMFGHDNSADQHFLRIAASLGIHAQQELFSCRHRLWQLYERSEECALHNTYDAVEEEKSPHTSNFVKQTSCVGTSPVGVATNSHPGSNSTRPAAKAFVHTMQTGSGRNGSWVSPS